MKKQKHNFFRGLLILMAFVPLATVWSQTHITDEAGLRAIGTDLAGSYILDNDIALSGGEWTSVGTSNAAFTGTFDGNGKIIKNLMINQSGSDRLGMFGYTNGATIKNLGLENVSVIGRNDIGVVAGRINSTTINKCYVTGYVEGNDHVGGIVGGTEAGSTNSVISNNYAYAYVYTRSSQVGGILGTSINTNVQFCYFAGQVVSPNSNTGGIVSLIDGGSGSSIESCICLAQSLKGGTVNRILANDGGRSNITTLLTNYSYDNTLVKGAVLPTSDSEYGDAKKQGANFTLSELGVQSNYDYLIWDFDAVWKIGANKLPVFKNQTLPLNLDMIVEMPATVILASGKTYQFASTSIIPGKTITYLSSDPTKATVSAEGLVTAIAGGDITISATTNADAFSNSVTKSCSVQIKTVNSNIVTPEDLYSIRFQLDGSYTLMNDIDLAGTAYENWEPISGFKGTLNGNGHVIKNFNVNKPSNDNVGFFGSATGATITKLGIEGASVVGGTSSNNGNNVGVLIGNAIGLTLTESYVANSKVVGRDHVGVLIGQTGVQDGVNPSNISDCYATGTMIDYANMAGGIVGLAESTTINNCYFSGAIEGPNNVGGIVGLAELGNVSITNCIALCPYLKGSGTFRVISVKGNNATLFLANNYARTDMKNFYGTDVTLWEPTDPNAATDKFLGASVDFAQTKEQTLYQTTLGWDFNNTWKIIAKDGANDSGIYPVLKWQTAKIAASVIGMPSANQRIAIAEELPIDAYGSHGQNVVYSSDNTAVLSVQTDAGTATFKGLATGAANALAQSTATNYMNAATSSFGVTVYDPNFFIQVGTADELNNMRNDLTANYKLTADIDLSGIANFSPIGSDGNSPFVGKFDGNGHVIRSLKISRSGDKRQALFGYTKNAAIRNLGLEDVNVVGEGDIGAVVGKGVGTTIERVYVTGYVEGIDHVGGIMGGTDGGNTTNVKNCYVNADVHTRASQVGGILGVAASVTIENTYFTGTVFAPEGEQGHNAGGIIGLLEDGRVTLNNVASLATSITGGTNSEFVARGSGSLVLQASTNLFTRSDMVISANATTDGGLGRATADQQKELSVFQSKAIYETTMGWDFTNLWKITTGNLPTFKPFVTAVPTVVDANKPLVYAVDGFVKISVKDSASIQIFDMMGKSVKSIKSTQSLVSLPLPQGIYLVKVISNGETSTNKVVNTK